MTFTAATHLAKSMVLLLHLAVSATPPHHSFRRSCSTARPFLLHPTVSATRGPVYARSSSTEIATPDRFLLHPTASATPDRFCFAPPASATLIHHYTATLHYTSYSTLTLTLPKASPGPRGPLGAQQSWSLIYFCYGQSFLLHNLLSHVGQGASVGAQS